MKQQQCNRLVPEPRMEGERPREPHDDAGFMCGLAACFLLKPSCCGSRGRSPSMQMGFWNKSRIYLHGGRFF